MNKKGFTLIEVIIAITIVSMIAVIIGSAFNIGIRAWNKGDTEIDDSQRLRFFSEKLAEQIKSAYPYQIDKDGKKNIAFQGESDSLWFVTLSGKGFKWVSYSIKNNKFMLGHGIIPDKKILEKISSEGEAIESEVSKIEFEYFSTEDNDWKKSWESDKALPAAIKIISDKFQPVFVTLPMGLKENEKK